LLFILFSDESFALSLFINDMRDMGFSLLSLTYQATHICFLMDLNVHDSYINKMKAFYVFKGGLRWV
jgi:hypothetical protein